MKLGVCFLSSSCEQEWVCIVVTVPMEMQVQKGVCHGELVPPAWAVPGSWPALTSYPVQQLPVQVKVIRKSV